MRIVTWNLQYGKGATVWPCLQSSLKADLMFLQESPRPDWSGGAVWENVPHREWGSAVVVACGKVNNCVIEGYEGWVVGGEWIESGLNAPERSLFVFSVHAPTKSVTHPRRSYVEEVVTILDLIGRHAPTGADLILGGDFNFLSLGDRKEGEAISTTSAEREAMQRIAGMGLVSCWTTAHPGHALAQTLRWSADKAPGKSTPYHCDGIFVPEAWKSGIICEVLTSTSFEVSDHYPVAVWVSR